MQPCPNCGQFPEAGETHCSNCGAVLTPTGPGPLITGSRGFDIFLGILLGLVSTCFVVGFILVPVLYIIQKSKHPSFALGLMIGGLIVVALLLGLVLTCFGWIGWGMLHAGK